MVMISLYFWLSVNLPFVRTLVQNLGHEQEFDSLSVVLVQLTNFGQEIADGHVFVATLKSPLETSCWLDKYKLHILNFIQF